MMYSESIKDQIFPSKQSMMKKHNFRKLNVVTNHYSLKINPKQKFIEWFVKIIEKEQLQQYEQDPNILKDALPLDAREKREQIYFYNRKELYKKIGQCILTGNTIFSLKKENMKNVQMFENHPKLIYIIEQKNDDISYEDLIPNEKCRFQFLRILNSNIKTILKHKGFVEWGRNKQYYNRKLSVKIHPHNITVFKGSTFKSDFFEKGLQLVVNPSNRIIRDYNIWEEFLEQKLKGDRISPFFQGKTVLCQHNQHLIRLDGADVNKNLYSKFPDPKFKNFKEYFQKQYNFQFHYDNQFLVFRERTIKDYKLNGEVDEKVQIDFYPPELLKCTGLTDYQRQDFRLMKDLGRETIVFPDKKFKDIDKGLKMITDNMEQGSLNFMIDRDSNKITGYSLQRPSLVVKGGNTINQKQDRIYLKGMLKNRHITNWVMFYDYKFQKDFVTVIKNLKKASSRFQTNLNDPKKVFQLPKRAKPSDIWNMLKTNNLQNVEMIFFFVPQFIGKYLYKQAKVFLSKKGIVSQFFTSYNYKRDSKNLSKFGNIVLQMSVKLGGRPWAIKLNIPENTVLMGSDISVQRKNTTIQSLISLFGPNHLEHYSSTKIQKKQNVLKNLPALFTQHIEYITKKQNKVPKNVIFYREALGQGQMEEIVQALSDIVKQLQQKYQENAPKILFVVVTKRVEDKFAVFNNNRLENPKGGFIAMDDVVKKDRADFYMISQNVNQGTATPTYYEVVLNQMNLSLPEIQTITYNLSYFYYNWMGPVKVPSVMQYAHCCSNFFSILQDDIVHEDIKKNFHYL